MSYLVEVAGMALPAHLTAGAASHEHAAGTALPHAYEGQFISVTDNHETVTYRRHGDTLARVRVSAPVFGEVLHG